MTKKTKTALVKIQKEGNDSLFPGKVRINVSSASDGIARGSQKTYRALEAGLNSKKIDAQLVKVGSLGLSYLEPVVEVLAPGKPKIIYGRVTEKEVPRLLDAIALDGTVYDLALARVESEEHVLCGTINYCAGAASGTFADIPRHDSIEYLNKQHRVLLRNAGNIDPENISEYIARGGYAALERALKMKPDAIVDEISKSGLRGRGGGGFPAGKKWQMCREAQASEKYLVCNVSEGEPGIGMHRNFLESDPHAVLEGLLIGGHALGASQAYVYIRDNYRLALQRFRKAVDDARGRGLLGANIMGSPLGFDVIIKEGGGRFVCGEETALLACLEGKIGEPSQRPPFPIDKGLFGKPTCINNVETWANVPVIIAKGSKWYSRIGSKTGKGTKVLSLAGNISRSGMIEVDMGTSLKEVIYGIGGGIPGGKKLKGIQTGGPSGGLLPADKDNITIDYDQLKNAGSMLGSGGLIMMDEDTDMAKVARYFTDFFVNESCGKCSPCREGMSRLRTVLDEIIAGRGKKEDLSLIKEIAHLIVEASACALGKTAPVPILSTLKHFPKDFAVYLK